jgi:hypothetical protein
MRRLLPARLRPSPALLAVALALGAAGCGPGRFSAGELLLLRIDEASVEFGQCTDHPGFRQSAGYRLPPTDGSGSLVFRVDPAGETLSQLQCPDGTLASCVPITPAMPMTIEGTRAAGGQESRQTPQGFTCTVSITRSLLLEERAGAMTFTQTDTFSLQGDAESCAKLEAESRALSTNDRGYQGCVVVKRHAGPRV